MATIIKDCTDYIIASDSRDIYSDAVNLLRNSGFAERDIGTRVIGSALIRQKDEEPDITAIAPDPSVNCDFIRNKYSLAKYDVCKVCAQCSSTGEEDIIRERELMQAIMATTTGSRIFRKDRHEDFLKVFRVYDSYMSEKGLNSYAMLNRMIYEALYTLVTEKKMTRNVRVKNAITSDQVYERWKFLFAEFCNGDGENPIAKCKIEFFYEKAIDKDDLIDMYFPRLARKKNSTEQEHQDDRTEEKTVRETAIEFDNINVMLGGEESIDRKPPMAIGDRVNDAVPAFTSEELEEAGFSHPDAEGLNSIGYEAIREKIVTMDVVKDRGTGGFVLLLCIPELQRCILMPGDLAKLSVFFETRKSVITGMPLSLFAFMRMNGQKMRLNVLRTMDRKRYLESVFSRNGNELFSLPAVNDGEVMLQKAFSFSMDRTMDNIVISDAVKLRKDIMPAEGQNSVGVGIRTVLSKEEWDRLKDEIMIFLARSSQFEVQNMILSRTDESGREIWFNVQKDRCRGFCSIITKAVSEQIRKSRLYPDVTYKIK